MLTGEFPVVECMEKGSTKTTKGSVDKKGKAANKDIYLSYNGAVSDAIKKSPKANEVSRLMLMTKTSTRAPTAPCPTPSKGPPKQSKCMSKYSQHRCIDQIVSTQILHRKTR